MNLGVNNFHKNKFFLIVKSNLILIIVCIKIPKY